MKWDEAYEILQRITGEQEYNGFAGFPLIRRQKCKALFELAGEVPEGGHIVDLGTHRGLTAITLALGSKPSVTVHTFDDYNTRRVENVGGKGLTYNDEDYEMFKANVAKLDPNTARRIVQYPLEVNAAASTSDLPIDLVFWDLWGERLLDDFRAWQGRIVPGGLFVAKVFEDGSCKEERLYAEAGWTRYKAYPEGVVYALKKTNAAQVFWIVDGDKYVAEAARSAASVAKHMPQLQQAIYQPKQREHKEWFLESTRLLLQVLESLPDGVKCLWLDSDTFMLEPVPELFEMLDRFDMVLAHAPGHVTAKTVRPIPACFPESQIGVIVMNNTPEVQAVWRHTYRLQIDGVVTDQAALREAVWQNKDVRFSVMPCEYDFRFQFGGQVRDRVKIIHGHAESAEIYEAIGRAVNTGYQEGCQVPPRLWHPKHGLIT